MSKNSELNHGMFIAKLGRIRNAGWLGDNASLLCCRDNQRYELQKKP